MPINITIPINIVKYRKKSKIEILMVFDVVTKRVPNISKHVFVSHNVCQSKVLYILSRKLLVNIK